MKEVHLSSDRPEIFNAQTQFSPQQSHVGDQSVEARLTAIVNNMAEALIEMDTSWHVISVNNKAEQLLGKNSDSLLGQLLWDVFPLEATTELSQAISAQASLEFEEYYPRLKRWLTVRLIPYPTGILAYFLDITARKELETTLRQKQNFLSVLLDNVQAGIVACDAQGRLKLFNQAARFFHGLPEQPLLPEQWAEQYDLYLPDGTPMKTTDIPLFRALQGEQVDNVEMMIVPQQGLPRLLSANAQAIVDVNGEKHGAVVVMQDITEHKQTEEKRVELVREQVARAAAESAQQQAAFLAEVSAVLASSLDYAQTLGSVANLAVPYFADWCSVDLLNDDRTISRVAVAHSDFNKVQLGWEVAQRYPRHLDEGYGVSLVMQTGKSEIAPVITDEQLSAVVQDSEYLQILRGLGLSSCIISPLIARGRVLGTISFVFSESQRHYNMADLALAEDLARRAAIAIDNARLYQEAQQAREAAEKAADRTVRLQTVTAALSQSLTPVQVVEVIVEQSMAVLEAVSAMVVLVSADRKELEIVKAVGYEPHLWESWRRFSIDTNVPLAEAIRTGEPVWMETLTDRITRYPHLAEVYSQFTYNSWMSLPLMFEGRAVGGMSLNFKEFKQLSKDDREFILAISRQCAQAISRAQSYEAERQARANAEQANRVKDEFLAVLSHELRSPLNPILGWTKLLQTQKLPPAKVTQALETIERNAKLQAQLIEDLLDISRMLQGKLSLNIAPVNLIEVIEHAIETVQLAAAAKSIQIQTVLPSSHNLALGDANRLQQVVWNLLSNAVKFTPERGRIEIKLEEKDYQIQIQVIDNGRGINLDFLPHVFEYFRQADSSTTRQFGGLGLGLAIVHQIIELHGGTVQAQSPGEDLGATFTVLLPTTQLRSPSTPNTQLVTQSVDLTGLHVLVVDDEPDMLDLAEFILTEHGAKVSVASSAVEVLTSLSQFIPDLLLCDLGMPEIDGYMLMQQIRELSPAQGSNIPAIALTAYASEYDRHQALKAGFQQHLSKPVEPEVLVAAIVSVLSSLM